MQAEWIDKIEVAKRQISEAIRLFFGERDPVVIHTIIASAHQILFDIGDKRGIASALKNPATVRSGTFSGDVGQVNYPFNFFKHADRDGDAKINAAPLPEFSSDFIMDAICLLQQIAGDIPTEAKVYWLWFVSKYSEGFENLPDDSEIRKMQRQRLSEWDFPRISKFIEYADIADNIQVSEPTPTSKSNKT
jgi:hypothetical protein